MAQVRVAVKVNKFEQVDLELTNLYWESLIFKRDCIYEQIKGF